MVLVLEMVVRLYRVVRIRAQVRARIAGQRDEGEAQERRDEQHRDGVEHAPHDVAGHGRVLHASAALGIPLSGMRIRAATPAPDTLVNQTSRGLAPAVAPPDVALSRAKQLLGSRPLPRRAVEPRPGPGPVT